ncbi:MAG: hypothetical protein HQL07_03955 [Nitrospirae bacterium]|nr:hypothetical protein [Magnetococcales bacterium]HAT49006.1 hypothetical protein [Alphaproteobacteria bacterium]
MIRIETTSQIQQAFGGLDKQVRYAIALALTNTAKDAQAELRGQLPQRFTMRTGWVAKGIRISSANKTDLKATVMVLDQFMTLQETGGDKTSPFGDALGIPVGARPTPTSVTRPGSFPGALLQKKGYFIAPIRKGSSIKGVWKRTGKGRRVKMQLMYVFSRHVRIKPRFGFVNTVNKVAKERFPMRFVEALQRALATTR